MVENYLEEIVAGWYRLRGYTVMKNVWFSRHPDEAQTDLDVLALTDREVCMVSCMSQPWSPAKDWISETIDHFEEAQVSLAQQFPILDLYAARSRRRVIVAEYIGKPLRKKVEAAGVVVYRLQEVVAAMLPLIKQRWSENVKLENPVVRTIGYLLDSGLLSDGFVKEAFGNAKRGRKGRADA